MLRKNSTPQEYRWFLLMWFVKMGACLAYTWMIIYYYGYGDAATYYSLGSLLRTAVLDDPSNLTYFFKKAATFMEVAPYYARGLDSIPSYGYFNEPNWVIHRLSCLISFFTFNRFLLIALFFANLGFWGFVIIYKGLIRLFPHFQRQTAMAALFIPSCIFWSCGLAKEPVCLLCEGVIFYVVVDFLLRKKTSLKGWLLLLLASYLLYTVKNYIFVCLAAGATVWLVYHFIQQRFYRQPAVKFALFFLMAIAFVFPVALFWSSVQTAISENIGETIASNTSVYQNIYDAESGGSLIQIESFDYRNPLEVLAFLPKAILNVMFRPWPWEISNVLMILTVLENIFFSYLFARTLLNTKFFTTNAGLARDLQVFVFTFAILLALVIGISTFNFGTLVRYRIPFLPFWIFYLLAKSKKEISILPPKVLTNVPAGQPHASTAFDR